MDYIIELISKGFLYFTIVLLLVAGYKAYLVATYKQFDIAEIFFSFFRFYTKDEIEMTSNKKRIKYMQTNNFINYFLYGCGLILLMVYFITRNA